MNKREIWDFLASIKGAQEFVSEVSAQFPIETIKANNKGDIAIYRQKPEEAKQ